MPLPSLIQTQKVSVPFKAPSSFQKSFCSSVSCNKLSDHHEQQKWFRNSRSTRESCPLPLPRHFSLMVIFMSHFHMCGPRFHHAGSFWMNRIRDYLTHRHLPTECASDDSVLSVSKLAGSFFNVCLSGWLSVLSGSSLFQVNYTKYNIQCHQFW